MGSSICLCIACRASVVSGWLGPFILLIIGVSAIIMGWIDVVVNLQQIVAFILVLASIATSQAWRRISYSAPTTKTLTTLITGKSYLPFYTMYAPRLLLSTHLFILSLSVLFSSLCDSCISPWHFGCRTLLKSCHCCKLLCYLRLCTDCLTTRGCGLRTCSCVLISFCLFMDASSVTIMVNELILSMVVWWWLMIIGLVITGCKIASMDFWTLALMCCSSLTSTISSYNSLLGNHSKTTPSLCSSSHCTLR